MDQINIFVAFLAGILSIFSPCILPILPSFIAYISGTSLEEINANQKNNNKDRKNGKDGKKINLYLNTVFFALGFSLIFLIFGAAIGSLSTFILVNQTVLRQIGGLIIIIIAFYLLGLFKFNFLLQEKKFQPKFIKNLSGWLRSFLIGIVFAFGWAPCYGPIIGAIFTLAATEQNFYYSILLFSFYSLGFLVPLLIFTFFIDFFGKWIKKNQKFFQYSQIIAGWILIILGLSMLTNFFPHIVNWLSLSYNQNSLFFF